MANKNDAPRTKIGTDGKIRPLNETAPDIAAPELVAAPAAIVPRRALFDDDEPDGAPLYDFVVDMGGITFYCVAMAPAEQQETEQRINAVQRGLSEMAGDAAKSRTDFEDDAIGGNMKKLLADQVQTCRDVIERCVVGWSDARPWDAERRAKLKTAPAIELGRDIIGGSLACQGQQGFLGR